MQLRPLSARSAVLSLLLGAHPPQLSTRDLTRAGVVLDIAEPTLRVALTRMVAAGDLRREDGVHRLSDRLLERQQRQDEAVAPTLRPWAGEWEVAVVVGPARPAAERAALRQHLAALRLAELREGVWLRPANLERAWPSDVDARVQRLSARPDGDPAVLATDLWDLTAWASTGTALLDQVEGATRPVDRFTTAAAVVRHLLADPVLPASLLPAEWPGARLRSAYSAYRQEVGELTDVS